MPPIGVYLHIPFCASKCPYCDFYSTRAGEKEWDVYTRALCRAMEPYAGRYRADTLYLGGGTPSLLGGGRLAQIVTKARDCFGLEGAEITVECNPASADEGLFHDLAAVGVNRLSLGMQSAVDKERRALGRHSSGADVKRAVLGARRAGISNLSLDLMLGVPGQTMETLKESLDFCLSMEVPHVSAYLLKLEEGTNFYRRREQLRLPEEDAVCDFYLFAVERLGAGGLAQYEISNFSKPGFESRHNLKYWRDEAYLGLGPSAHSFLGGKRFYFTRSLSDFEEQTPPVPDGTGGDLEEFCMLRLRLNEGLREADVLERFGCGIPEAVRRRAQPLARLGLLTLDDKGIALSSKGFLLSNSVIGKLLL